MSDSNPGSCLCGTVTWLIDSPLANVSHCHCAMCRKMHGSAFGTYALGTHSALRWLSGATAVKHYESSPGFERAFCGICGSVLPNAYGDTLLFVPLGCQDGDDLPTATEHIFTGSKAPWHTITDDLERFETYPPGIDATAVHRDPHVCTPGEAGVLRGSCLCNGVAYEVQVPLLRVDNCHCQRCRKARAAAYATDGITVADGVKFTRGADRLIHYKLPAAHFFTQVFCATCGSAMPCIQHDHDITIIPFGSLDDDPGTGAQCHIFVASKASWFQITDDLPQFDTRPGE